MPSADAIADRYQRLKSNISSNSNPPPILTPDGGGAAYSLGNGWNGPTHFFEQDVIKPLETIGSDVYNGITGFGSAVAAPFVATANTINKIGDTANKLINLPNRLTNDFEKAGRDFFSSLNNFTGAIGGTVAGLGSILQPITGAAGAAETGFNLLPILLIGGVVLLAVFFIK